MTSLGLFVGNSSVKPSLGLTSATCKSPFNFSKAQDTEFYLWAFSGPCTHASPARSSHEAP
ncbi:hypothetical protein MD484_g293, partial [Candolleomyces efflorescens]